MEKKSVTFFMLYHKRPEVTRMSMWHMAKVIDKFRKAGHECKGIVIGSEPKQAEYCKSLGLQHLEFENDPLPEKFKFAFESALMQGTDYICWLGSNNVHSDKYWETCLDQLSKDPVATFGSTRFTIVNIDKDTQKTMAWSRRGYHLCSCGQFYNTNALKKTIDFHNVFRSDRNLAKAEDSGKGMDFDGSINNWLAKQWTPRILHAIDCDGLSVIDIKSQDDVHSFERYFRGNYPQEYTRDEIFERFEELQKLEDGYFKEL